MDKKEFEEYETVKYWMNSLPSREGTGGTKYHWKRAVRKFCEWAKKTPDELIRERKEDLASNDDKIRHRAEMRVKDYIKVLEQTCAPNTRKSQMTAIRNFYNRNYCELKFFRRDGPRAETISEGTRAATKEDIQKMVEISNPREKALILFLKDTGLSESDAAKLKLKNLDVKDATELFMVEPPLTILTKRVKTGVPTVTFLGREGLDALRASLKIRMQGNPTLKIRRYGKLEIKGGLQPEDLSLESPLFRSYGKFLRTLKKAQAVEPLTGNAISVLIRKAALQAGIWKEGFSAHALRRFFQTSLESSGINRNWIMSMMGHRLPGVEGSYSKPEINMLKEAYVQAYRHLAISEVAESQTRIESLELQTEKLILNGKRKETQLSTQDRTIMEQQTYIDNMEKRLNDLEAKAAEVDSLKNMINTLTNQKEETGHAVLPSTTYWSKKKDEKET